MRKKSQDRIFQDGSLARLLAPWSTSVSKPKSTSGKYSKERGFRLRSIACLLFFGKDLCFDCACYTVRYLSQKLVEQKEIRIFQHVILWAPTLGWQSAQRW
jgi:hypothetical protein